MSMLFSSGIRTLWWVFLYWAGCSALYALDATVGAEGAILINAKTGVILYEKNAYTELFPASTTKMATALYVLERHADQLSTLATATRDAIASITPDAKIQSNYRSPPHWVEVGSTHIGIKLGEEFPLYDLLAATLIASANDAANVVAQHISGKVATFMEEVNGYLQEIGCQQTCFINPHGLHHPAHKTTPYDLARIAQVGLQNPIFRQLVSTPSYKCAQTNLEYERTFLQTNLLLRKGSCSYAKAIGVKTGTTQMAGKNLVAAAQEGARCLILVLMGHRGTRQELYEDATLLFERAFQEPKMRRYLMKPGEAAFTTKVIGGTLHATLPEGLFYDFYPSEEIAVKTRICWKIPPLPLAAGNCVGLVEVTSAKGGLVVQQLPLYAASPLSAPVWQRVSDFYKKQAWGRYLICGGAALLLWMGMARLQRRHSRFSSRHRHK